MYFFVDSDGYLIIVVWVDDFILTGTSDDYVFKIKKLLMDNLKMKDLGPINNFLGIKFAQFEGGISMSQSTYLRDRSIFMGYPGRVFDRGAETFFHQNILFKMLILIYK